MSSITIFRRLQVPKDIIMQCEMGGIGRDRQEETYIGSVKCNKNMLGIKAMEHQYEGIYPIPKYSCGGGDPKLGHKCAELAPGFTNPHITFIDEYTYTMHIDLPYY